MTDYKKVFIDTAPFIYYIEKNENNPLYYEKLKHFFSDGYKRDIAFVSSVVTLEEYLVFPYRIQAQCYITMFHKLIDTLNIEIMDIHAETAMKAAKIRAEYKGFKGMDALQLAVATRSGCDLFLTNDKQLRQFKEIKCILVDELT